MAAATLFPVASVRVSQDTNSAKQCQVEMIVCSFPVRLVVVIESCVSHSCFAEAVTPEMVIDMEDVDHM